MKDTWYYPFIIYININMDNKATIFFNLFGEEEEVIPELETVKDLPVLESLKGGAITDNRNNGLITKIWGSSTWTSNHAITFGYPIEPNEQQKKDYHDYFVLLGKVLPCKYCRDSYNTFITSGDSKLTNADLESRETLTKWFY